MKKKDLIDFLNKFNDDDDILIEIDEEAKDGFTYTSIEKDMFLVYKEIIDYLSENPIDFNIRNLCEMVSTNTISNLQYIDYVNVDMEIHNNKLCYRISKKDLDNNEALSKNLFSVEGGIGFTHTRGWDDDFEGQFLLPLKGGNACDKYLCVSFGC